MVRLVDALEDHPGTSEVTDADTRGDVVFTAAGHSWVLDFQAGPDAKSSRTCPAPRPRPTGPPPACCATSSSPRSWPTPAYRATTSDCDTLTVHLATGRHYTLALTPAA